MGDVRDLPLEAGPLTRHLLARTRHQGLEQITRGALRAAPALLQPLPKTAPGSVLLPPVAPLGLVPLPLWRQPQDPLLALATQPVLAPAPGPAAYQSTAVSRAPAARSAPPEPAVQPSAAAKEPVALSRPSYLGYRPSTEVISEEPEEASVQHTAASEPQQVLSSSTADTKPGKEQAPAEDKEPVEEQERQPDAVNCEPASPECSSTSTFVCDLERSVNLSHSSFDPSSATNTRPGSPAVRYRTLKQVESENYSDSDDILRESVLLKLCSNMSSANSSPARSRAGVLGTAHLVDDAADHSKDAGIMPSVSPMPKLQMQRPPPLQVAASAPVDALGPLALKLQAQRQVIRPIVAAPVLHAQGVSQVASSGGSSGGGADQSDQNSKGARSGITALFAKKKKDAGPVKTSSDVMNGLTAADQLGPLQRGMAKLAVRPVDGSGALSQASAESVYATPVKEASNAGSASADSMSGTAMAYDSHASGKSGQQPMPDLAPSLPQSHGSSQASSGMPAPGHPHLAGGHLSRMGETMRAIEMGQGPLAKAMSRGRVGMAADVHKQPMPAKSGMGSTFTFDQLLPSADPLAYGAPSAYITEEPPAALMPVSSAGIASNLIPPAAELGNLLPKSKSKKLPTMPAFLKQAVHQKQEQHRPDAQQEQQAGGTAPAGSTPAGGLACILESDEVGPQSQIAAAVSQMRLTAESSGASEPVSPRHTAQRPLRQQHQLHVPVQPSEDSAAELYAARAGFNFRTMPNANTTAVAAMTHSIAGTGVSAPPIHAAPIHVAHVYTAPVLATTVHEVQQAPRSTVAERALAFQQQMQSASQTPPQQRGRQAVEQAAGSASKKVAFAGAAGGPTVVWQSPFGAAEHVAPVASPGMAPGAVSKGNSVSAGGADTSSQTAANAAVLEAAETAARSLSMPGMHMQVGSTSPAPAQTKGQGLPPLSPGMASAVTGPQQSFMTAVSSAASSHPADDGVDSRAQPGAGTRVQVGDAQAKRDPSPLARSVSIPGISPAIMAALKRTVTIQKQEAAVPAAEPAAQPPSMPVMAAPYGPPEPAMAVSAQTSLQPHALSFKGASQAMSTGHTSSSNGSEVVSAPRAGAVGTPPGVSSAWYAGVQHPGVNEAEPAARPGHVEAGVQRAPGWRAAPMSFADAAAARAAERLARVEQEASVSVNLPAAAKPPKPTPHAGMLPLPPAAVPPPGSRTPPPPPPPGPPPPPPLVTGFSAAPVLPKSRASTSTATQSSENGAASVASSVSVASSGAMADVLSMIKALGEGGQHKGHLRSLSKSKAKRGTKGQQVATAAAAPKVPAGSPLGGLGALGAATAAAAQVRGSMQAHALLQRVRSSMRVQDEDSSDDEYFG